MANILVVDDEHLTRNALREVLKLNKHSVVEASDRPEALETINPNSKWRTVVVCWHILRNTVCQA